MARRVRSPKFENRTQRLKLPVRKKPTFLTISHGIGLGYRRNASAGTWVARCADGHGHTWTKGFASADDHEEANGETILDYWQACEKARALARGTDGTSAIGRPVTFAEAIEQYADDLAARGGRPENARSLRTAVPSILQSKPVSLLAAGELRKWRDAMLARGLVPASVTRICKSAAASLNLAARLDERITNQRAWKIGLAALPDSNRPRNDVLNDDMVRHVVAACYAHSTDFGLFVELLAVTGARPVQVSRLLVGDLQADRILMPRSAKGRAQKRIERRPLPLAPALIAKLKAAAGTRLGFEPLLRRPDGRAWVTENSAVCWNFARALAAAGLRKATPYSLRHSSITRMILSGVPVRVVADCHDTSVRQIEAAYSHLIADHSDALVRAALLDLSAAE